MAIWCCTVASLSSLKIVISDILSSFCTVVTVFIDVAQGSIIVKARVCTQAWSQQHKTTDVLHVGPAIKICAALCNLDPKIAVQLIFVTVPDYVHRHKRCHSRQPRLSLDSRMGLTEPRAAGAP